MKVIDILNKIANGEEVKFKILDNDEIKDEIFEVENGSLRNRTCGKWIEAKVSIDTWESISSYFLNKEIEIIEEKEETKPITKESIEALGYACGEIQKCFTNGWNKSLKNEPLIEEDKKIEKLENEKCFYDYATYDSFKDKIDKTLYLIRAINLLEIKIDIINDKTNEIIDYINKEK